MFNLNRLIKIMMMALTMLLLVVMPVRNIDLLETPMAPLATLASETTLAEKTLENDDFEVNVQIRLCMDVDKRGDFAQINIKNKTNSGFKGTVYLRQNRTTSVTDKYEISVDEGQTISLTDSIEDNRFGNLFMDVKIKDSNDKEVYYNVFEVTMPEQTSLGRFSVGVLSYGQDYLKQSEDELTRLNTFYSKYTIPLLSDRIEYYQSMPKDISLSESFDIFIIDGYDTTYLDKKDKLNLMEFVENGGYLVIGTGSNAEKVLGGFSDIISYRLGKVNQKRLTKKEIYGDDYVSYEIAKYKNNDFYDPDYSSFVNVWDNVWTEYYKGVDIAEKYPMYKWTEKEEEVMLDDEDIIYDEAELEINNASYTDTIDWIKESVIEKGEGRIIILPVSIEQCKDFLTVDSFITEREYIGNADPDALVVKSEKTNVTLYIVLIIVYIVVVIAAIIYVSKKLNKSYLAGVTVAATAALFSIIYYGAARELKMGDMLGYITINTYDSKGSINSYTEFCVVNQENSKYRLDINVPEEIYPIDQLYYYNDYYDDDTGRAKSDNWDESRGIIIDKTQGVSSGKIQLNSMTPYTLLNFCFTQEFKSEGCFEFDKKDDGYVLYNNTGKDMKCVAVVLQNTYFIVGDLKNGEEAYIDSLQGTYKFIDYTEFMSNEIDESTAISIAKQYESLDMEYSQAGVCAVESLESDIFSSEWKGFTIAAQRLSDMEDLGMISLESSDEQSVLIGEYDYDYDYDHGYNRDNEYGYDVNDEIEMTRLYTDAIMLYDINNDSKLKSIRIADSRFNDYIMDAYSYEWDESNYSIAVYNYTTNAYDIIFSKNQNKVITDTKDYYGVNKPVRIKLVGVPVLPEIILEVQ